MRNINLLKESKNLLSGQLPIKKKCTQSFRLFNYHKKKINILPGYQSIAKVSIIKKLFGIGRLATQLEINYDAPSTLSTDIYWRSKANQNLVKDFSDACTILLRMYLPMVFLEGFSSLYKCSNKYVHKYLFSDNHMLWDTSSKFISSTWSKESLLFCHQHGGGYGIDYFSAAEDYEKKISNTFYTWGWKDSEKTRILPAQPRIMHLEKAHIQHKKVLIVCVNYPKNFYKLGFHHQGKNNLNLIKDTIQISDRIKNLDVEIKYYPHDYGWNVEGHFHKSNIFIPEISNKFSQYGLYICNYVGTTWLETLFANKPTICYYDPEVLYFRKSFLPYLKILLSVGIFHTSIDSLVDKVFDFNSNPNKWWKSNKVQTIRLKIIENYAKFSPSWEQDWEKEFSRILKLN